MQGLMQGLMQGPMPCLSNFKKIQWILSPVMSSESVQVHHWKLQLQITPLMPMIGMPINHHYHFGDLLNPGFVFKQCQSSRK
jgi:hypothetical protein